MRVCAGDSGPNYLDPLLDLVNPLFVTTFDGEMVLRDACVEDEIVLLW